MISTVAPVALLLAVLTGITSAQGPVTVSVPKDYPTIQDALDDIASGTTVLISKGTYTEALRLDDLTDVTLRGKGKVTIVAPNPSSDVLRVDDCGTIRIEKLRFDGGFISLYAINTVDVTVERCRFEGDSSEAFVAESCGSARVERCRFMSLGTAALFREVDGVSFVKNRVDLDTFDTGVFVLDGGDVLVERCRFTGGDNSDGVSLGEPSVPGATRLVTRNRFKNLDRAVSDESETVTIERNRAKGGGVAFEIGTTGGAVVERNKAIGAEVGFSDFSVGSAYDRNVSKGALEYGFEVDGQGHTFTKNRASKSGLADLRDTSGGQNTYADDNTFKVTILE